MRLPRCVSEASQHRLTGYRMTSFGSPRRRGGAATVVAGASSGRGGRDSRGGHDVHVATIEPTMPFSLAMGSRTTPGIAAPRRTPGHQGEAFTGPAANRVLRGRARACQRTRGQWSAGLGAERTPALEWSRCHDLPLSTKAGGISADQTSESISAESGRETERAAACIVAGQSPDGSSALGRIRTCDTRFRRSHSAPAGSSL